MAGVDTGAMAKLAKDIEGLSEGSWQKARKYVDKLQQIDRLDAAAEKETDPIGRLTESQRKHVEQMIGAFKTLAKAYAKEELVKKPAGSKLECSFCGKRQDEARKLVTGRDVCICDECIELCMEIIEEDAPENLDGEGVNLFVREFPLEKHRLLWKTMARKSKRIVSDWKKQRSSGVDPLDFLDTYKRAILSVTLKEEKPIKRHCYCCEFAYDAQTKDYDCEFCPMKSGYRCIDKGSPFRKMITAMKRLSEDKFKKYALEVADSPLAAFVKAGD